MTPHAASPAVVVPIAVGGMLAVIAGANLAVMLLSGWYALAKAYPKRAVPHERARGVSGKVGWAGYNGGLVVGVDPDALYLAAIPPLNLVIPGMSIPWSALRAERRWTFLWTRKIRYRTARGITIELHGRAADLADKYGQDARGRPINHG